MRVVLATAKANVASMTSLKCTALCVVVITYLVDPLKRDDSPSLRGHFCCGVIGQPEVE